MVNVVSFIKKNNLDIYYVVPGAVFIVCLAITCRSVLIYLALNSIADKTTCGVQLL